MFFLGWAIAAYFDASGMGGVGFAIMFPIYLSLRKTITEPRVGVVMFMVLGNEGADATWLLAETGLTWGNLSSHMTKLEQVGYVEVSKEFVDNKPKTMVRLTQDGRQAFLDYRQQIQDMLNMPIDE